MGEAKRRRAETEGLSWPTNLALLHEGELRLRREAIRLVLKDEERLRQINLIESSMDLLQFYLQNHTGSDDDARTVQHLGIRVFNACASALNLSLSGYSQAGVALQRDILETVFLVEMFASNPEMLTEWRTIDEDLRERKFGPLMVRTFLDTRDGFTEQRRRQAYKELSRLGAHPTMVGFRLLRPDGTTASPGPFIKEDLFAAVLNELARIMVQAGNAFAKFLPNAQPDAVSVKLTFYERTGRWLERYYGQPYDPARVDELRELIAVLRQRASGAPEIP